MNRPENWVECNRKLWGILGLAGLENIITKKSAKLTNQDIDKLAIWEENQKKLESLLALNCRSIILSYIGQNTTKNAIE